MAATASVLSIVIVSYNARPYLHQTLLSVRQAMAAWQQPIEVWVVDNASQDGCAAMVATQFPEFSLIESPTNVGFSKANNLALEQVRGEHVLLLNPDTVLGPTTLPNAWAFMVQHPGVGAIGLQQLSPRGRFMPESRRGLPTPWVSFYKLSGLAALFPKSKKFGAYYQGHLPSNASHPTPVLSGAALWVRKEALDTVGLLDERFFMYGEDIDLSYRLNQGGYPTWYCAEAKLIHYKGRSTPSARLRYVWVFYQAMLLFAAKHFGRNHAAWYWLLKLGIGLAAGFAFILRQPGRLFARIVKPELDATVLVLGTQKEVVAFTNQLEKSKTEKPYQLTVLSPDQKPHGWHGAWHVGPIEPSDVKRLFKLGNDVSDVVLLAPFQAGLDVPTWVLELGPKHSIWVQPDGSDYLIGPYGCLHL